VCVLDRLAAPELEVPGREVERSPAELVHPDLEGDPRPGRGLLEDHPERSAGEKVVLLSGLLLPLQLVRQIENLQELVPAPVATRVNDLPFTRPRSYAVGVDKHALRFYPGLRVKSMKGGEMATLVRWEPFREIAAFQDEMSRFMNGLLEGNGRTNQAWVPPLDVWETEDEIVYAVDLPGIPEEKISVELDDGALTISAERERVQEESDERFYRFERRNGTFSRTFGVPQGVAEDDIAADYENGVLEVHVKKPEQPKPKRIQVGSGATATIEGKSEQK
jgi:HSP20 family protein